MVRYDRSARILSDLLPGPDEAFNLCPPEIDRFRMQVHNSATRMPARDKLPRGSAGRQELTLNRRQRRRPGLDQQLERLCPICSMCRAP